MAKKGKSKAKGGQKGGDGEARRDRGAEGAVVPLRADVEEELLVVDEVALLDDALAPDEADAEGDEESGRRRTSVVNGTHVTVAFPFSRITSPEPSEELHGLAALVADLVDALADAGVDGVAELRDRAVELRERIAGLR